MTVIISSILILLVVLLKANCTIIAIKCADGIVLGSDSLLTGSSLIGSRSARKVFLLTEKIAICSGSENGGGSDFFNLCNDLKEEIFKDSLDGFMWDSEHELKAYNLYKRARQLVYTKYSSVHAIICGLEEASGALFEVLPSGSGIEGQAVLVCGPGASVVVPLLEELFPAAASDSIIAVEEGVKRVVRVLAASRRLDPRSGGKPSVWVGTSKKWNRALLQ
jgi:20S proteasome alpha/beta subunit